MNCEPKSRKTRGFQSTDEPQTTGNVIRVSWVDRPLKCDPGVGFSRFIGGPASLFIGGPLSPRPVKSTSRTPVDSAVGAKVCPLIEREKVH